MLSKKKWFLAIIFVIFFITWYKLESNDTLSSDYTTMLMAPQKPSEMYAKVKSWVAPEEDLVSVSGPVLDIPAIEYTAIQPFDKGAILSLESYMEIGATNDGLIIYTGYTKKTGKTLSVLYDSGETVTYGFVDEFYQLPYTTVNAGEPFASVKDNILYMQVEKDGEILETNDIVQWLTANYE